MPLVALLMAGCASLPSTELVVGSGGEPYAVGYAAEGAQSPAGNAYESAVPSLSDVLVTSPAPEVALSAESLSEPEALAPTASPTAPSAPQQEKDLHGNRFTAKLGYFSAEDADALDDGWILNLSWMRYISNLFAVELELGYIDADGSDGAVDADVWAIPLMVNGRLNLPIWVLDAYGGLGIGTIYYDAEADGGTFDVSDDGFLWAGNAFIGASVGIADALALGLEAKYYVTDDISDFDAGLDAFAVMLTLGFSR
jgi:hypothetical protein